MTFSNEESKVDNPFAMKIYMPNFGQPSQDFNKDDAFKNFDKFAKLVQFEENKFF